jgi:hypothetical protein
LASLYSAAKKDHAEKLHELPDEYLTDVLPIAKKIAAAQGLENYNLLQNNGKIAHQVSGGVSWLVGSVMPRVKPFGLRPRPIAHSVI